MTAATTINRPATARPVHDAERGTAVRTKRPVRPADTLRPADRRLPMQRRVAVSCADSRNSEQRIPTAREKVFARRRAWAAGAVTGVGLMLMVAFMHFFGGVMEQSADPARVGTEVVHVQSGESLGAIASRIAPEMPTEAVVAKIMELNAMSNSAVSVGQALVTPVYVR
jgi:LysM domain